MEIVSVKREEFSNIIPKAYHVFGTAEFGYLNRLKVDDVYYLIFKDSKYRLGITLGTRDNVLFSPFSAPFGGFVYVNREIRIVHIDSAVEALIEWAKENGFIKIIMVVPPAYYDESFITKQSNTLFRKGFTVSKFDLNFFFRTKNISHEYQNILWRNAKKNLRISLNNNLCFHLCINAKEKQSAYEIIMINRREKNIPLNMTWTQVEKTALLINADYFTCCDNNRNSLASAIVFHSTERIVRIIYWGDIPSFSHLKPMNFLAYNVFKYYYSLGIEIIDIGISTVNSEPNHGLCEFKESLGCDICQKLTFSIDL